MTAQLRAIDYARVSAVMGRGDDLMSPDIQHASNQDWAKRNNATIVETLTDLDLSGKLWKTRTIEHAVAMIEQGNANIIIVYKWSRISRDRLDWALAVDRVESVGGQLLSSTEPFDPSPAGRLGRGILSEFNAYESELIGANWTAAHTRRFTQGLSPSGRPPFGWCKNGRGIQPSEQAPTVAELYRRYIHEGQSFHSLATWLNQNGVTPNRAPRWHPNTVRQVLDNPVHAGFVTYKDGVAPGAHQPLIDEATWLAYQATRRDTRRAGRREGSQYLLSGLVVCTHCGHKMSGTVKAGKERPRYVCAYSIATGAHTHSSCYAHIVDDLVADWLETRAQVRGAEWSPSEPEPACDTDALLGLIVAADRKLSTLTGLLLDDTLLQRDYVLKRDEIEAQRVGWLAAVQHHKDRAATSAGDAQQAAMSLMDAWDSNTLPVLEKRALLRTLVDRVDVTCGPAFSVHVQPTTIQDSQ